MNILKQIWHLLCGCFKWFYRSTVNPTSKAEESAQKPLPPIRYDGDVTDIYLA